MSFIAGYIRESGRLDTSWVNRRVTEFSILTNDDPSSYENGVHVIPFGHLLWKFRKNFPLPPNIAVDGDNILLTLGFHLPCKQKHSSKDLVEKCRHEGANILEHIEGEFVSVYSDGSIGALHIVNDRFASRPMFIFEKDSGVYFSSNLLFLQYFIQEKLRPDIAGIVQLFSYNHPIGERTTIKNIQRFSPASHVILTPKKVIKKSYWDFAYDPDENLTPDTYSQKVFDALKTATQSRTKLFGDGVVALSGGLDSRLLAGALPINSGFRTFTFVDSTESMSTPEVNSASAVAQELNLKHTIKCLEHEHISSVADDVARLTGGLIPLSHPAKVMKYILDLTQNKQFFLMGGGPGNYLSGDHSPTIDYFDPKNLEACTSLYCEMKNSGGIENLKTYLLSVFREDIIDSFLEESVNEMNLSIKTMRGPTTIQRIAAWEMCYRFPAFTANSPIHNHPDVMEAFAHLDYAYCDLMSKLPATWMYNRNFYKYMIYLCLPELRHIIYPRTGQPINGTFEKIDLDSAPEPGSSLSKYLYCMLEKNPSLKYGISSVKNSIYRLCGFEKKKATPSFLYEMIKDDDRLLSYLVDAVYSYPELRLIFDPVKCQRFIKGIQSGQLQTSSYICDAELVGCLASICYTAKWIN